MTEERRRLTATLMLVLVTLLWGATFPLMKEWQDSAKDAWQEAIPNDGRRDLLASFTLLGVRMTLSMLLLAFLRPQLARAPVREHRWGLAVGVLFAIGCGFQFVGLARTTPALSAFITSLASAWVPVLAFCLLGVSATGLTLLGLCIGLGGVATLPNEWALAGGEGLTFISTIPFALQILLVDRLGKRMNPAHLTLGMLTMAGVSGLLFAGVVAWHDPGASAWAEMTAELLARPNVLAAFLGLIALAVATFHWMNIFQPRVPASRAALIYLLEPLFAALFSIALGYEGVTQRLLIGGALIVAGNLLAELPGWLRERTSKVVLDP